MEKKRKNRAVTILIMVVLMIYGSAVYTTIVNNHEVKHHKTYIVDGKIEYRKSIHN